MSSQVAAFADGPYAPILSAPVNIEGTDLSLATEILPAPPPVAFIRLPMNRRPGDLAKRPLPSFIPTSDPGSTYATHSAPTPMVTTTTGVSDDQGRRKRARLEKLPLNRASRSSTRYSISLAPASSPPPELLPPPIITPQPAGPSTGSRSSPASDDGALASEPLRLEDTPSLLTNKSKKGRPRKGKLDSKPDYAKTEDAGDPEVTREPVNTPFRNDDICACCSISHHASNASPLSHFLYCDGCTRSFHMGCLDPPIIDNEDMPPPDKDWFCPACSANKASLSKSPTIDSPFDHLIYEQGLQLPQVFSLPEDIKAYFKNIATGYQGVYVDTKDLRSGKANRYGFLEDRDPYRLKDRNNNFIICYRCNRSSAPGSDLESLLQDAENGMLASRRGAEPRRAKLAADAAINSDQQRIISCDYCNLHWHLDCLDPPMTVMPPPLKKWMCPNHADHVMPPRRSTKNPRIIEVKHPGTRNNGNIEIIPSAEDLAKETVPYDEIYINNRRYLIPEKAIRLDFLQKAAEFRGANWKPKVAEREISDTFASSPLTSLTSLTDDEDRKQETEDAGDGDSDSESEGISRAEAQAAQMLLQISKGLRSLAFANGPDQSLSDFVHSIFSDWEHDHVLHPANDPLRHQLRPLSPSTSLSSLSSSLSSVPDIPLASPSPRPKPDSHVKAGSTATSFRIRLNRSGSAAVPGASPSTVTTPSKMSRQDCGSVSSPAPPLSVNADPLLQTSNCSLSGRASPSAISLPQLSPQEIRQLLRLRSLVVSKGEQRVFDFFSS